MNCSIENCENKVYAKGWCRRHYRHVVEGGHDKPLPVISNQCSCGKTIAKKAGSSALCRECYYQKWLKENKHNKITYQKQYREANKEKIKQQIREWSKNNKDKINNYYSKRRKDPRYRLIHNLRSRLYDFLSGKIKHKKTEELVGCSFEELKKHLESKFQPGMSWDNYGSYWCIDHIKPYSSIAPNDKIGIEQISHFSNLRPLTIKDNCQKAIKDKMWKKIQQH